MRLKNTFLALVTFMLIIMGCSAVYRETRLIYNLNNQGWMKDSVNQFGNSTVECTRKGVTIKADPILDSRLRVKRIGLPVVPLLPAV